MAFADAFGAALALAVGGEPWTGDPEPLLDAARWAWRDVRVAS